MSSGAVKRVLFICVHNSGRSQMAEAFFNQLARGKGVATSAGTRPAVILNPTVVKVMREIGIDMRRQRPKPLTLEMMDGVDRAITMGWASRKPVPPASCPPRTGGLPTPRVSLSSR